MEHSFKDKLFAFIGEPERCARREVRDALSAVGGVVDERITAFTNYVVAFRHNGKTDKYKRAVEYDRKGLVTLINEEQFFDILNGKAEPPVKPERDNGVIVIPGKNPEAEAREKERINNDILNRKRMNSLAKYGVPTSDSGRVKIDLRPLDTARRIAELMKSGAGTVIRGSDSFSECCDKCGNPVRVHIGGGEDGEAANLCLDCYNRLMAGITGADFRDELPKRISYKSRGGKTHEFEIELMFFPNGKTLTATEIGKTKRKADVHGEPHDDMEEMLETLKRRIKKALAVTYMQPDGYVKRNKAVGYIEYNDERDDHDIVIDGKPYTWEQLKKNISAHEGWKIKIEFGDVGDELD